MYTLIKIDHAYEETDYVNHSYQKIYAHATLFRYLINLYMFNIRFLHDHKCWSSGECRNYYTSNQVYEKCFLTNTLSMLLRTHFCHNVSLSFNALTQVTIDHIVKFEFLFNLIFQDDWLRLSVKSALEYRHLSGHQIRYLLTSSPYMDSYCSGILITGKSRWNIDIIIFETSLLLLLANISSKNGRHI